MKQEYMQAFTEVNEIIELMPMELVNKIPIKFREMLESKEDKNYKPNIQELLENQKLKNETIIILGLIYRDFLCSTEERKMLQEKDAKELQEIQQKLEDEIREKYNPDDFLKKKRKTKEEYIELNKEKSIAVISKEKWYQKIFNLIKRVNRKT